MKKYNLEKIDKIVKELIKEKQNITTISIAKKIGMTRQRASQIFLNLGISIKDYRNKFNIVNKKPNDGIFDNINTEEMTIKEIYKAVDYKKSEGALRVLILKNNIKYKNVNKRVKFDIIKLDTESMTLKEIHMAINYDHSLNALRGLLNINNIKYKAIREKNILVKAFNNLDTKDMTCDEILDYFNNNLQHKMKENTLKSLLYARNIPFKRTRRGRKDKNGIHN